MVVMMEERQSTIKRKERKEERKNGKWYIKKMGK
jgi:hypothetical protein